MGTYVSLFNLIWCGVYCSTTMDWKNTSIEVAVQSFFPKPHGMSLNLDGRLTLIYVLAIFLLFMLIVPSSNLSKKEGVSTLDNHA